MTALQRTAAGFIAIVFLVAVALMTAGLGFGWGIFIYDLVAVIHAAICGWIAWRGHLEENQPILQSGRIERLICELFCFIFGGLWIKEGVSLFIAGKLPHVQKFSLGVPITGIYINDIEVPFYCFPSALCFAGLLIWFVGWLLFIRRRHVT